MDDSFASDPWGVLASMAGISLSLVVVALFERLIHAFFSTVWHITIGFHQSEAKYTVAAMQLICTFFSIATRIISSVIQIVVQCFSGLLSWTVFFAVIVGITGILYIAYEQHPSIARVFGRQWNSYIGPQLYGYVLVPLDLLTQLFKIFLPIYNTFTWILRGIFTSSILPPILKSPGKILQALTATSWFAQSMVNGTAVYTSNTFRSCDSVVLNSSVLNSSANSAELINPFISLSDCVSSVGMRTIDLITPMYHMRQIAGVLIGFLAYDVCRPVAVVAEIVLYPLTDINFAKFIHNIGNAILWIILQVPVVTTARCKMFRDTDGIIMCIPDFDPAFQFFMEAFRKLGQAMDNWLDILFMVIEKILFPSSQTPTCEASPLSVLSFDNADEKNIQRLLFGSNFTTVLGLTETLFAMTDGVSILYYSTDKLAQNSEISQNAWPIIVDPRMGIAAVKYSPSADASTTSLMGCR